MNYANKQERRIYKKNDSDRFVVGQERCLERVESSYTEPDQISNWRNPICRTDQEIRQTHTHTLKQEAKLTRERVGLTDFYD